MAKKDKPFKQFIPENNTFLVKEVPEKKQKETVTASGIYKTPPRNNRSTVLRGYIHAYTLEDLAGVPNLKDGDILVFTQADIIIDNDGEEFLIVKKENVRGYLIS